MLALVLIEKDIKWEWFYQQKKSGSDCLMFIVSTVSNLGYDDNFKDFDITIECSYSANILSQPLLKYIIPLNFGNF